MDPYKTRSKLSCHFLEITHIISSLHLKDCLIYSLKLKKILLLFLWCYIWFSLFNSAPSVCVCVKLVKQTMLVFLRVPPILKPCVRGRRLALSVLKVTRFQTWASWRLNPGVVWGFGSENVPRVHHYWVTTVSAWAGARAKPGCIRTGPEAVHCQGEGPQTECRIL